MVFFSPWNLYEAFEEGCVVDFLLEDTVDDEVGVEQSKRVT